MHSRFTEPSEQPRSNPCAPYVLDSAIDWTIGTDKYSFTASDVCVACVCGNRGRRHPWRLITDEWDQRNVCRTACKYRGKDIAFHVNEGSTSFWLSLLVEFEDGDGDIASMQLKQVVRNSVLSK
jgi:hypothetical protein